LKSNSQLNNQSTETNKKTKDTEIAQQKVIEKTSSNDIKKSATADLIPKILLQRENYIIKRLIATESIVKVELFDNGTIDNDTVSLYHNNEQVIKKGKLNYQPLTYLFNCGTEGMVHELILVAENLGEIPPNTAVMVVTIGKKRQEIFLTSDEKKNAKIIIDYKPN